MKADRIVAKISLTFWFGIGKKAVLRRCWLSRYGWINFSLGNRSAMDQIRAIGYHMRPPHLVAQHKGFFAKEGLDVQFEEATYAPARNEGMSEGVSE